MTQNEREQREQDLLNKDVTELTPEDLDELRKLLDEEDVDIQDAEAELEKKITETNEFINTFINVVIKTIFFDILKGLSSEGAKEGVKAFFSAFNEYSKNHKGSVHELLTDPDLPEILQQIRERAEDILKAAIENIEGDESILQGTEKQQLITEDTINGEMLIKGNFYATYSSELIREFTKLKKTDFYKVEYDDRSILTADTKQGTIRLIDPNEVYSKFMESFGPMALKLFDLGLIDFARKNYHDKAPAKNLRVDIDFKAFAKTQKREIETDPGASSEEKRKARNRRNDLINEINRNLTDLSHFSWQIEGRGKYRKIGILQTSHRIENNIITFYFDQGFADCIKLDGIMTQEPTALLYTDNTDPNAYQMGRYIANHHGNDRNAAGGTESTLSIKSLISAAPAIPTFEKLRSQGRRDWKRKIKTPLERSFNDYVNIEYWEGWEYRHPRTGKTYTQQEAEKLSSVTYEELMVDYIVKNAPSMKERRERREQERHEREQKQIESGIQPKKRGRPKKTV